MKKLLFLISTSVLILGSTVKVSATEVEAPSSQLSQLNNGLWEIAGEVISPRCFPFEWTSSDNWEELADHYGIDDLDKFIEKPAWFIGTKINNFDGISNPWPEASAAPNEKFYVARPLSTCSGDKLEIKENSIVTVRMENGNWFEEIRYVKYEDASPKLCDLLAPNFKSQCTRVGIFQIGNWRGGSQGFRWRTYIYGLYPFERTSYLIVPLKRWSGAVRDEAKEFISRCSAKGFFDC